RERHRARPWRALRGAPVETGQRRLPYPRDRAARRDGTEPPQRPAPPVPGTGTVLPAPVVPEPVAEPTGVALCVRHEPEVALDQPALVDRRVGLAAEHDQTPGHVVGAVTVLSPGDRAA